MIVRMKEIVLFTLSSSMDQTVQQLGSLGVVDIKEVNLPASELLDKRFEDVKRSEKAIAILQNYVKYNQGTTSRKKYISQDPKRLTDRILISIEYEQQCKARLEDLHRQLEWYKTWGEHVNTSDFEYLRKKGIYVRLYQADPSEVASLEQDHSMVALPERNGKTPVVLVTLDENEKLSLPEDDPPMLTLGDVRQEMVKKERQLKAVNVFLEDQAENLTLLYDYLDVITDYLEVQQVLEGMGDIQGTIKYVRGFIPTHAVGSFKEMARQNNWGYQISEPENPEEVPVYIKNPKWIRIIDPVMKFIDIVPGYKELDVSIYFLIAFALFFAMLVGDAGYGGIFLLLTFWFRKKLSPQVRLLIYVLSGATIVWGVLSGTYFGAERIAAIPFLNSLIIEDISSFGVDNITFMMHLSFTIGAIHLTLAHGIRSLRLINSTKALSEFGWILLVWGLFFVAEKLVLGKTIPQWNNWLFVSGALLVTLFNGAGRNLIASMLVSIGNLPLSLINGFSDIVSYVRLFAVGMATATVASSFNNMIIPAGVDLSFLEMLMAVVALFFGHALNIVLALMAVMVHGIRLNMLEFAGHLGIQFSGEAYKPFKLRALSKLVEKV